MKKNKFIGLILLTGLLLAGCGGWIDSSQPRAGKETGITVSGGTDSTGGTTTTPAPSTSTVSGGVSYCASECRTVEIKFTDVRGASYSNAALVLSGDFSGSWKDEKSWTNIGTFDYTLSLSSRDYLFNIKFDGYTQSDNYVSEYFCTDSNRTTGTLEIKVDGVLATTALESNSSGGCNVRLTI